MTKSLIKTPVKRNLVQVRLNDSELKELNRQCKKANKTHADYVRFLIESKKPKKS